MFQNVLGAIRRPAGTVLANDLRAVSDFLVVCSMFLCVFFSLLFFLGCVCFVKVLPEPTPRCRFANAAALVGLLLRQISRIGNFLAWVLLVLRVVLRSVRVSP